MSKLLGNLSGQIGQLLHQDPTASSRLYTHEGNLPNTLAKSDWQDRAAPTARIANRVVAQVPQPIRGGNTVIDFDTSQLTALFGANPMRLPTIEIGAHPDFRALKQGQMLYHHCVSMFVDIKGSTRLINKLDLPTIRRVKNTLLSACGHVANFFGGHVHRLQGDAAFLQFVRADTHPNDSIINALNAASVLCLFVSQSLADEFTANGYDPLKIRVGIDYGTDEEVLWSHYGIDGATELTTTSLHTDLAAKLQAQAANNEVRLGANIIRALDLPDEFWEHATNSDGSKDYYIFRNADFSYGKYIFDWRKFLLSYDFATRINSRIEVNDDPNRLRLVLDVFNGGQFDYRYAPNAWSLPKNRRLVYKLFRNGQWYQKSPQETVEWQIENRGNEAGQASARAHAWRPDEQRQPQFETSTSYLGHHYLNCRIKSKTNLTTPHTLKFPLFIR